MKLAIIGYGKMGKEIETVALSRGHEIIEKFDDSESIKNSEFVPCAAIDFTEPTAFKQNYKLIAEKFDSVIVGTTGWDTIQHEVINYYSSINKSLIYSSNFSLGVNVLFELIQISSKLLSNLGNYDPYLLEMHHKQKKDAPSGTAKTIAKIIAENTDKNIEPVSIRSGFIKGIHEIGYESEVDRITLKHEAYSRKCFAEGAIIAAELINEFPGVWNFQDILKTKFRELLK